MNTNDLESVVNERKEFEKLLERAEKLNEQIIENDNYYEAKKQCRQAEKDAINIAKRYGNNISIRSFRPDDLGKFMAGDGGLSKNMGENDTMVSTGTNENIFVGEVPMNSVFVIKGVYLFKSCDIYIDYLSMYINDVKQRWYRGSEIESTNKYAHLFRDPLVIRGSESFLIKFLTTSDGLGSGKAKEGYQINIKGVVVKSDAIGYELKNVLEKTSNLKDNTESIMYKLKDIVSKS